MVSNTWWVIRNWLTGMVLITWGAFTIATCFERWWGHLFGGYINVPFFGVFLYTVYTYICQQVLSISFPMNHKALSAPSCLHQIWSYDACTMVQSQSAVQSWGQRHQLQLWSLGHVSLRSRGGGRAWSPDPCGWGAQLQVAIGVVACCSWDSMAMWPAINGWQQMNQP